MAKCFMCGKEMGMFGVGGNVRTANKGYPIETTNYKLCEKCYGTFFGVSDVVKIANCEIQSVYDGKKIEYYKKYARKHLTNVKGNIENTWLKDEVNRLFDIANDVCDINDDYDDIVKSSFEKIIVHYSSLPREQADCGLSTFATDGQKLYFMKYGMPVSEQTILLDETDFMTRVNTARELKANVLEKENLIESIPIDRIIYFQEKGDIGYSSDVSGGGSKGVSYGGAVLGGLLFGTAGAVVGAMSGNKIDEIKTETVMHDNRYVAVRYVDDEGKTTERQAPYVLYSTFNKLIPEKEYSYINLNNTSNSNDTTITKEETTTSTIPVEELKALKELLDLEIITEEDFQAKKKQLLGI